MPPRTGRDRGYVYVHKGDAAILYAVYHQEHEARQATRRQWRDRHPACLRALAAIGDTYMFTKEMLRFYMPFIIKNMKLDKLLAGSGAIAILHASAHRDGTVVVQSMVGWRKKDQPAIADLQVAKEDLLRLARLARGGTPVTVDLQSD